MGGWGVSYPHFFGDFYIFLYLKAPYFDQFGSRERSLSSSPSLRIPMPVAALFNLGPKNVFLYFCFFFKLWGINFKRASLSISACYVTLYDC